MPADAISPSEVILLFGGPSGERRVSVASAQNLLTAFAVRAAPICWFWTPDGAVQAVPPEALRTHERPSELDFLPDRVARFADLEGALDSDAARGKVFLLALHGGPGEDGTLQRCFEDRGLAFTGSGSTASGHAFDKALAHEITWRRGLRVPESCVVDARDLFRAREVLEMLLDHYGKAVLKPVADGSSIGLIVLCDESDVEKALGAMCDAPTVAHLAEAFIGGVELTVGVVEEPSGLRALPCSEVRVAAGRTFDYAAKYLGQGAVEITPAAVTAKIARASQEAAATAHRALECSGYSRTDLIIDERGPVFLETNTLPGLTSASFIPQQLEAAGIPLRSFVDSQLALARRRAAIR